MAKPFEPRELLLRIGSILKRTTVAPPKAIEAVRFGEFTFHLGRGELTRGGESVRITEREREHAAGAGGAAGETVPRLALGGRVAPPASGRWMFRSTACAARWSAIPANPSFVQTVRGIGYRLW